MQIIDAETGAVVGTLTFPDDGVSLDLETDDEELKEIVGWAVTNPVPLRSGGQNADGSFYTTETPTKLGDEMYPQALKEFLQMYGLVCLDEGESLAPIVAESPITA